jgi:hypothetical protein
VQYISYIGWAFKALSITEFSGRTFSCNGLPGCEQTGEVVLQRLSFDDVTLDTCVWALVVIALGAYILGLIALSLTVEHHMSLKKTEMTSIDREDGSVITFPTPRRTHGHKKNKHGHAWEEKEDVSVSVAIHSADSLEDEEDDMKEIEYCNSFVDATSGDEEADTGGSNITGRDDVQAWCENRSTWTLDSVSDTDEGSITERLVSQGSTIIGIITGVNRSDSNTRIR